MLYKFNHAQLYIEYTESEFVNNSDKGKHFFKRFWVDIMMIFVLTIWKVILNAIQTKTELNVTINCNSLIKEKPNCVPPYMLTYN